MDRHTGGDYDERYRIVRPDGSTRWVRELAFPVVAEDGRVRRIVGIAADITDLVAAAQRNALLASILTHMPDAVEVANTKTGIEFVNPAHAAITGYAPAESVGRGLAEATCPDSDPQLYR